ncbi:unnamed protein product [Symbiodinium sp. CCMP2456]|nr:unnamed protein product [Symbiodinium sp. CCMP2456]
MHWKLFAAGLLLGGTLLGSDGQHMRWLSSQRDLLRTVSSFKKSPESGPVATVAINPSVVSPAFAALGVSGGPASPSPPGPVATAAINPLGVSPASGEAYQGAALGGPASPSNPAETATAHEAHIPNCPELSAAFHWGWDAACTAWKQHDETCELFNASEISRNASLFLEVARRSRDRSYHPSLARLQIRLLEAKQAGRPLRVLTMGPSNTVGRGCREKSNMYWASALEKLSKLENSPLQLEVIEGAVAATPFKEAWSRVLIGYEKDETLDLIIPDYAVTCVDVQSNRHQAFVMHAHVRNWKRPPALLFIETYTANVMASMGQVQWEKLDACTYSGAFEEFDPFYPVLRSLRIPMLSYPDIACALPHLGHPSDSVSGIPYLFTYKGASSHHYGCGVHFIQAQMIYMNLLQILRQACIDGYPATLEAARANEVELKLQQSDQSFSVEDRCKMSLITYLSHFSEMSFPGIVANTSKWRFGADRPGKFGWIANWVPEANQMDVPDLPGRAQVPRHKVHYSQYDGLGPKEIVFVVKLRLGLILLEFLSTYQNIGSVWCQVEEMSGKVIAEPVRIDGLWSTKASLANSAILNASTSRASDAAVRCTCEENKFKFLSVSAC